MTSLKVAQLEERVGRLLELPCQFRLAYKCSKETPAFSGVAAPGPEPGQSCSQTQARLDIAARERLRQNCAEIIDFQLQMIERIDFSRPVQFVSSRFSQVQEVAVETVAH